MAVSRSAEFNNGFDITRLGTTVAERNAAIYRLNQDKAVSTGASASPVDYDKTYADLRQESRDSD